MKWLINAILMVLLCVSVIAAGGGGGGGSGGGGGGGSSGSSAGASSSGGGSISFFTNLHCDDKGVLLFRQKPAVKPVAAYHKDGTVLLDISGTWKGSEFISEEAVMKKAGVYTIPDQKNGNQTVECPGLKFSCKIVGVSLHSCQKKEGRIKALLWLENVSMDDVKLTFSVGTEAKSILSYDTSSKSSGLDDLTIKMVATNMYQIELSNQDITALEASTQKCAGSYYKYAQIECSSSEQSEQKEVAKLKCGGHLDIKDRVACRLQLRDEEKDEYENFFPEECRSWEDKDACVGLYKKVQPCWKVPEKQRIACLQQKVGIGTVKEDKEKCRQLAPAERGACVSTLEKNVHALVKLHLYHLEEKAEELEEEGKITKEQLADFVVKMEESKLAYNKAPSKDEKRNIILQARKHWVELMRKVRA